MRIPSPRDLGLPPKFDAWRPNQLEALGSMMRSPKRFKVPELPTGSGKSAVNVGYALWSGKSTCFVTESIGLMDQMMADFSSIGLVSLMGRRRYRCDLKPDYTCEEGRVARCPHHGSAACPLSQAEHRAATSKLVVTNYDKWTSARKFGTGMSHFEQVIFDEGHLAPEALARAMQVLISDKEVETLLGFDYPACDTEMVDWKKWAMEARQECEGRIKGAQALVQRPDPKAAWVRDLNHLKALNRRLITLATCQPQHWIVDRLDKGYQFDPVVVGRYGEPMLFMRVPTVIITSATLPRKLIYELGVGKDHFDYWEFPSDFNPSDCPIYYYPMMRVDKSNPDLTQLWVKHDQIAAPRRDRKGITHTISYLRAGDVQRFSRFSNKMVLNAKGEPSTETVELFKSLGPGHILVSPSVGAGFDFPGSDCEWQFVCKIPFPDSRSKIVLARQEHDKEWGPSRAAMKLQQIFGRGARFRGDRCENFIGDMHLDWFMPRYSHLFSKTFHRLFRRISVLPTPPPPMRRAS